MPYPSFHQLNEVLVPLALEAGRLILDVYYSDFSVQEKSDASPVTQADQKAEALILKTLIKTWPDIPIVAEEQAAAGVLPAPGPVFFLVDPLDGTKEFINRRDEFTVNIALIVEGQAHYGLVLAPALGRLYVTLGDRAAGVSVLRVNEACGPFDDIVFKPLKTRAWPGPKAAAVVSRSHIDAETEAFLNQHQINEQIVSGSSLKFCLLAEGVADIYPRFGPTMEWDTAAGHAVLQASGGIVIEPTGAPFAYGKQEAGFLNGSFIALDPGALEILRLIPPSVI